MGENAQVDFIGRAVGLNRSEAARNRESILDALIMLKTGRVDDGIAALEAEFFPHYADEAECRREYEKVMGLEKGRVG
ncbi:MAG: hypothetical protein OJJ21_16745 [Ferrovibrio sp.]|uniref:hypothetical protein n=1 Tax=Ferrovibrio sp. TaxID=1917215 RepID=UPI002625C287|nr:hypothetical protein [Ferrovibrio sp.]MCW0235251.1 hypothetical protein [Ferrovibrio sp.]